MVAKRCGPEKGYTQEEEIDWGKKIPHKTRTAVGITLEQSDLNQESA